MPAVLLEKAFSGVMNTVEIACLVIYICLNVPKSMRVDSVLAICKGACSVHRRITVHLQGRPEMHLCVHFSMFLQVDRYTFMRHLLCSVAQKPGSLSRLIWKIKWTWEGWKKWEGDRNHDSGEGEREDEIGKGNDRQLCGIVERPEWKREIKIGGGFWEKKTEWEGKQVGGKGTLKSEAAERKGDMNVWSSCGG